MISLDKFLKQRNEAGGFSTEDALAALLPLMKQAAEAHLAGNVAPLDGIEKLQVEGGRIFFVDTDLLPIQNRSARIRNIQRVDRGPVDVVSRTEEVMYVDGSADTESRSLDVSERDSEIERPIFVPGYVCWEQIVEHHDPLTDIFNLGQLLATLTLGIDFRQLEDVRKFVKHRHNPFAIKKDVHPVIARAIVRMTELHRDRRVQELPLLIKALENYRQQDVEISVEPSRIDGFESRDLHGKQQVLLDRLQKRLFEISRRNRMLHFRPTMQSINLTQASVPMSFDYKNVRDDQVLICNRKLEQQIAAGKKISLNKRLNFSEAIYLPPQLNRIARETRRDLAEYGFEQLRIVLCMLHWSNLKEKPHERFSSPLVLVPVQLKKKRGVRDTWNLHPLGNDAEINPVIRYLFKQLYDIELPERIDLETTGLESLFQFMSEAISNSEPAVELKKVDRPQIRLLYASAKKRLDNYRRRARISGRGIRSFRDIDYSYDPATYHPLGVKIFSEFLKPPETVMSEIMKTAPRPRHYAVPNEEGDDAGTGQGQPSDQQPVNEAAQPKVPDYESPDSDGGKENKPKTVTKPEPQASEKKQTTVTIQERQFYDMEKDDGANPYNWTFDLCSVTLANFRYRKMSLVRDYESLVNESPKNAAFEAAFSLVPRSVDQELPPTPPLSDRYDVVPCDPTQATSIAQARAGSSYIVQGPPGTGKSQTITNLIADFAARGKRVLFVCEKRAAIDVVFARLRQCGLGDLCCLIHDSQADKKSFVMDLKDTYESFLDQKSRLKKVQSDRTARVTRVHSALKPLEEFSDAMRESTYRAGLPTRQLVERCIELDQEIPELTELDKERLPSWAAWHEGREAIETLTKTLQQQQPDGILARHPLRNLRADLATLDRPTATVSEGLAECSPILSSLIESLNNDPAVYRELNLAQLRQLSEHCERLMPLAQADAMSLLDQSSEKSSQLKQQLKELHEKRKLLDAAREENSGWKEKIAKRDLQPAIDSANQLSKKWVPIIRPGWWRLRGVMKRSYDFDSHAVKPGWVSVLTNLQAEYAADDAVEQQIQQIGKQFNLENNTFALLKQVESVRLEAAEYADWLQPIHQSFTSSADGKKHCTLLAESIDDLRRLKGSLDQFVDGYEDATPLELQVDLNSIDQSMEMLPDYLVCLEQLRHIPDEAQAALRSMNLRPEQIEAAAAQRTLQLIGRDNRQFERFNQVARAATSERLETAHNDWMNINAEFVRQKTQSGFLDHVHKSSDKSGSGKKGKTEAGTTRSFAKRYTEGRKVLEHEFGKQMRYKSIRDLVSGDSGLVVRDLKPIWLMSPLSVSDTLPLNEYDKADAAASDLPNEHDFDVVIFDEASQITLESSIPTLFRAAQAIVVGDEQQLPPTDFFSAKKDPEADEEITFEHEGETVAYDLESNSLLNHASRNLPSTMLGWHYRSRDEALISFSNWAFYNGRLLTIPEESIRVPGKPALIAESNETVAHVDATLDRPISFHHMQHGVYLKRRNRPEAEYIAGLVREILMKQDGRTIGVIAFSEAQQDEIERAIDRLAKEDAEFSNLLEAELVREDDGQFVGLLVKNLENIQGDERDVIILSVCYGPDDNGRMIMNFGPINKSGGEKRLNVAFSRAKHHMAIVSTIKYSAITNEYNSGANCLRNYLRYAESLSAGDAPTATTVLHGLSPWRESGASEKPVPAVLQKIAERLADQGLIVDFNIGHSEFRCDMGLRKEGDSKYRLGILVDAGDYYESDVELMDRELFRPRLLKIFGWDTYSILLKDWLADSDQIIDEIMQLCADAPAEPAVKEATLPKAEGESTE